MPPRPPTLRFQDFELDFAAHELRRAGEPVHLERRPMDALITLVARRGELVTREELIEQLWGKKVVIDFDTGLNTLIRKIRQVLGDSVDEPVFVVTVPGKGYRFIAPVVAVDEAEPSRVDLPTEPPSSSEPTVTKPVPTAPQVSPRGLLRRPWPTVLAILAIVVGVATAVFLWPAGDVTPGAIRIAVLPFDNLSAEGESAYLADGLTEDTINSLAQFDPSHLQVIGPASTAAYKRSDKPFTTIGDELDADYAVQGALRAEGSQLRVTIALIRVEDQVQVWTAAFDRELTSVLGLQRELSAAIAQQVRIRLSPERAAVLAARQTADPEAYDLYLRGRHAWSSITPAGNRAAASYYERAIAKDPHYALAWAGLAMTFSAAPINSDVPPSLVAERARDAARRAVEHGPDLSEAYFARGYQKFWLDRQWRAAESDMRRAVELDPNHAMAHLILGHLLSQLGEQGEARVAMRGARELDPLFPLVFALSSQVAFQARDYEDATEYARQAIAMDPHFWVAHMQLGQVLEQLDDHRGALEALELSARYSGGNSKPIALRSYVLARMGRTAEALEVLAGLERESRQRYVPPYSFALINVGLAREAEARRWLELAFEGHDVHLAFMTVDPKWDVWRNTDWFREFLARCGFEAGNVGQETGATQTLKQESSR